MFRQLNASTEEGGSLGFHLKPLQTLNERVEMRDYSCCARTVSGDVVARHHGGASGARDTAGSEASGDEADRSGSLVLVALQVHLVPRLLGGVLCDLEEHEIGLGGRDGVAKLGDGQRQDLDALVGHHPHHLRRHT